MVEQRAHHMGYHWFIRVNDNGTKEGVIRCLYSAEDNLFSPLDEDEETATIYMETQFKNFVEIPAFWALLENRLTCFIIMPVVNSNSSLPTTITGNATSKTTTLTWMNGHSVTLSNVNPCEIAHRLSEAMSVDIDAELCKFYHSHAKEEKIAHLHPLPDPNLDDNN